MDYAALATYLREPSSATVKETVAQNSDHFPEKSLDTIDFYRFAAEIGVKGSYVYLLAKRLDEVDGKMS